MTRYGYRLELLHAEDESVLLQSPCHPDFGPVLESVHFEGVRRGVLPPMMAAGEGWVEPVWDASAGEPFVTAFRAVVPGTASSVSREIHISYVRAAAEHAGAALVERGILNTGDTFTYRVSAFPMADTVRSEPPPEDGLVVEEKVQPLQLSEAAFADFTRVAVASQADLNDDTPVFLPRRVLDDVTALARAADDSETGGVLIGRLHRDRSIPEIFVEVTAQIPAAHTRSSVAKLTFTSDTWAAARAAIAQRQRGEIMLGNWHSHPDFCRLRGCPDERRRRCPATWPRLSDTDRHLIAAVFPRAFHLALLVSDSIDGWTCSLFGWRLGLVVRRGFYTLGAGHESALERNGETAA